MNSLLYSVGGCYSACDIWGTTGFFFNGGGMKLSCMGHTSMSMEHGDDRLTVFYRYI